jgi:hypothetical protein
VLENIAVRFYEPSDISEIRNKWCALATDSQPTPFLDWSWISSWLDSLPCLPKLLEASMNSQVVGLALFCIRSKNILPGVEIKQLWLHRNGQQAYDQTWIEHNDFLLHYDYADIVRQAMLKYLKSDTSQWNELYLGMATEKVVKSFCSVLTHMRTEINSANYIAELSEINSLEDYLAHLSKNTRSQITRTKKLLEQQGELKLNWLQVNKDKIHALKEVAIIHKKKWETTAFGSGFDNPTFVMFHQNMLLQHDKVARLYCLSLDQEALGYIYILKSNSDWYFYLSAMTYSPDNRVKIGLLAHSLMIEEAIKNNATSYSFLAGEARYKRSMSNKPHSFQQLVCFYQPSFLLKFREFLRELKRKTQQKYHSLMRSD